MKALVAIAISLTCVACKVRNDIAIENVWARATPPGSTVGSVYAIIEATREDELVSVTTPVAERVEIHATAETDGAMRMRPVERVALTPNEPLKFETGGLHLMLIGLREPLAAGATFPLAFNFRSTGSLSVNATIVGPGDEPTAQ